MKCPYCGSEDSKVIDSRNADEGIRRRRQCLSCGFRFTTYERIQSTNLLIIKKDQRREEFSREKLATGIRKACEKRPLPIGTIEKLVDELESELHGMGKAEIPSSVVGELVMERLRQLDGVAYIRFASVYRAFADIEDVKHELDSLAQEPQLSPYPTGQLSLIPGERHNALVRRRRGHHTK